MDDFLTLSRVAFRCMHGLEADSDHSSDIDCWIDAAQRHRVVGLWADGLPAAGKEFHRLACGQMVHSTRLSTEAERIVEQLGGRLDHLRLVKGPALAVQAWPRSGLRSFDDLDFRCDKKDFAAVVAGMQALGYRPEGNDPCCLENLWHFGWGIGFTHSDGFLVEFNHRMFPPHYPWTERLTAPTSKYWKPQLLDQRSINSPDPALHLLLCCSHAVWHGWERLSWMVDIAGLLVRFPGVLEEAERLASGNSFLRRSLHTACSVADRIFGPLPNSVAFNNVPSALVDQACGIFIQQSPDHSFDFQRKIHCRLMTPAESLRYTTRRVTTPGDLDFQKWPLPASFRGLYWPLRPLRCLRDRLVRQGKMNRK